MVGPETEIVQQHQPQSTPQVAEKGRLPAPTEAILSILPFDRAILMIIARYPVTLAARLESNLPVVSTSIYASANLEVGRHRLSRGRRDSRGLSRGYGSRRCEVCEECRNTQGFFVRSRCRGWMAGLLHGKSTKLVNY